MISKSKLLNPQNQKLKVLRCLCDQDLSEWVEEGRSVMPVPVMQEVLHPQSTPRDNQPVSVSAPRENRPVSVSAPRENQPASLSTTADNQPSSRPSHGIFKAVPVIVDESLPEDVVGNNLLLIFYAYIHVKLFYLYFL